MATLLEGEGKKMTNTDDMVRFLEGGNAYFTIVDRDIGRRFTYHLNKAKPNPRFDREGDKPKYWLALLTGPDEWRTLGIVQNFRFIRFMGTYSLMTPSAQTLTTVMIYLRQNAWNADRFEFWHAGRCCICGRTLTVPESIDRGIGPECFGKMGGFDLAGLPQE